MSVSTWSRCHDASTLGPRSATGHRSVTWRLYSQKCCAKKHQHIIFHKKPSRACRQTRLLTCSATPGDKPSQQDLDPTSLEAAAHSVETIWALAKERNLDELLRFVPDSVVDVASELSGSGSPLTFRDVVHHAPAFEGFSLDSFAVRHLFHSPPTHGSVTRLSCMHTAPDRAVLRYEVAVEGGERAVLTFGLECVERLAPHYRSARVEYVWQLVSVSGEPGRLPEQEQGQDGEPQDQQQDGAGPGGPDDGDRARRPHPSLSPEAVVQAQVAALECEDTVTVFAFASPSNQAVTGPLERFTSLLRNPMYRPLLRHRTAETQRRRMVTESSYVETVKIVSDNTGMPQAVEMVYLWEVSRQGPDAGPVVNCWMTDSVRLVTARALN